MRALILVPVVPLSIALSASAGFACGDGKILFEDKMSPPSQSWGLATRTIGPSGVTWELKPNTSWTPLNQTSLYTDFEACLTASMNYPETSNGYFGLDFWGVDNNNNYSFDIFPKDGGFGGYRIQSGKTLKPVPYQKNDAIKIEPNAPNEIDVVVRGTHAVLLINGTQVAEFDGVPPDGGGLVGLDMGTGSSDSGTTSITFTGFQVREVPAAQEETPGKGK